MSDVSGAQALPIRGTREQAGGRKAKVGRTIPLRTRIIPYLAMGPALLVTCGILACFAMAIFYSFTNYNFSKMTWSFVGFDNWTRMFSKGDFWHACFVTFSYSIVTTGPQMILGLGIALVLNKYNNFFTRSLKLLLVFPLMIAPVIATLIWQLMTNTSVGVLEKLLNLFGIYGFPWAASSSTALFTVALIDTWVYTPFVIVLISAGLNSLPKSPFEAARIDGGSAWFTFKTLTLPMLKPFLYIALIFRLMMSFQEFAIIYALTKGGPGDTLMNLSITGYNIGLYFRRFGASLPYLLFLWLIIFVISKILVGRYLQHQKNAAGES